MGTSTPQLTLTRDMSHSLGRVSRTALNQNINTHIQVFYWTANYTATSSLVEMKMDVSMSGRVTSRFKQHTLIHCPIDSSLNDPPDTRTITRARDNLPHT